MPFGRSSIFRRVTPRHVSNGASTLLMRDPGVIDALDGLKRYARAFDEISRESDAH